MKSKYFILFSNCLPVKGYKVSIIIDLQRGSFIEIPNLLFEILSQDLYSMDIKKIKNYYNGKYNDGIDSYFSFLHSIEYGFFTDEPKSFPKLNLTFETPFKILTSVICINEQSDYSLENVLMQISDLGVQSIQLRIFKKIDFVSFISILKYVKNSRVQILEIFLKDFNYLTKNLITLLNSDSRIIVYLHSTNRKRKLKEHESFIPLNFEIYEDCVEIFSKDFFVINIPFYCESQSYNVGLNKKISIDSSGNIKNYIDHKLNYGHVNDKLISEIIELSSFKKKWFVNNDNIEKCKDCQFRYSCPSNSDIIKINEKNFKKHTCNYNPYLNIWK